MLAAVFPKRPAAALTSYRGISQSFIALFHQDAALTEYTDVPQYPKILAMTPEAKRKRKKEEWHEKVTNLPTVEQKMMELNMPRYWGHWACHVKDNNPMLLSADFCRFATRTHLREGLPEDYYQDVWEEAEAVAGKVAGQVEQLIDLNYNTKLSRRVLDNRTVLSRRRAQNFLLGLHRVLSGALQDTQHIKEATVDMKPRIEAYWILGSLPPDNMMKKTRHGLKWTKDMENDPVERSIQGTSNPFIGVRVEEGLPEVVARDDVLATAGEVPTSALDPRSYGLKFKHYHATTTTGSWPSEGKQHGHLFLHTKEYEERFRTVYGEHNLRDAFVHKALVSSFSQAQAHATYLGFGPVTELTYPLVQQSVFTNGRRWTLGLYQLNTCALHSEKAVNNPYNNILWLSEEEELFEGVDSGGVKGLNTSLLTSLVAVYLKKGVARPDPTPYLPLKYVANHPACEEYREEFHQYFLWLSSNRKRARDKPEMYLWEKIYKVDFKTRPFEPPRRFFEPHFNQKDPGQQRLDDYAPHYIPKAQRKRKWIKFKPRLNTEHLYKYD